MMASKRHTAEQIISKLREAEVLLAKGTKMLQVCRKLGITEQTYYRWRKEYGGVRTDQVNLVEVKETLELPEKFTRRLLNGGGACPPEDCGGTTGYEECCEAMSMSKSDIRKLEACARGEVESRIEWLDGWQPEAFDLEAVRKRFER